MATYKQIQDYVKMNCGYVPKTCWIAHVRELNGLAPRQAPNRHEPDKRVYPCPNDKRPDIERALTHYREF